MSDMSDFMDGVEKAVRSGNGRKRPLLIGVGFIAVCLWLLSHIYTVSSGFVGVVQNWGAASETVAESGGLHLLIPVYQKVTMVSTQPVTITSTEAASTHDLQNVTTHVAVTFHIAPGQAVDFWKDFRNLDNLAARIIRPTVSNDVKAITADYNAEELVTKRELVDGRIRDLVIKSLAPYHMTIEAVNTSNFAFSKGYSEAIENKQIAQQQALAETYTLEGVKVHSQQIVINAKAQADADIAKANGDAQSTIIRAEATKKSNILISSSLTPDLIRMKSVEQWNGVLPVYTGGNGPLPFLDVAQKPASGG